MSVADAGIQGVRLYAAYENAIWFAITISIKYANKTWNDFELKCKFIVVYSRRTDLREERNFVTFWKSES